MSSKSAQIAANIRYGEGRALEHEGALPAAIKKYQKALSQNPTLAQASNRLMIIFRKQKEYKKELAVIKRAIESYEQRLAGDVREWAAGNQKSAKLSRALAKSLGLLTSKGMPVYEDQQVSSWKKRMKVVQKKIK